MSESWALRPAGADASGNTGTYYGSGYNNGVPNFGMDDSIFGSTFPNQNTNSGDVWSTNGRGNGNGDAFMGGGDIYGFLQNQAVGGFDGLGLFDPMSMGGYYPGMMMDPAYEVYQNRLREIQNLPAEDRPAAIRQAQEEYYSMRRQTAESDMNNQARVAETQLQHEIESTRRMAQMQNEAGTYKKATQVAAKKLFTKIQGNRCDEVMPAFVELVKTIIDDPSNKTPDGKPISIAMATDKARDIMDELLASMNYTGNLASYIKEQCNGDWYNLFSRPFGFGSGYKASADVLISQIYHDGEFDDLWTEFCTDYNDGHAPSVAELLAEQGYVE